jgi:type VI secretion system secreted protein VgrG
VSGPPQDQRQAKQYLSIATTAGNQKLQVSSLRGIERLSVPFAYELELYCNDSALDWQSLIGTAAAISINGTGQASDTRYIHGVFTEFALAGAWPGSNRVHFRATLRPNLALLDMIQDCRIFQNMSVVDIVKQVLSDGGVTEIDMRATKTYTARDYCVQWRETALNFMSRLMEDEGLFYWFEHTASAETLVIADDADGHTACPVVPTVTWTGVENQGFKDDQVHDCGLELRMVPDSVGLNAWNFETPSTGLYALKQGQTAKRTISDWGYTHTQTSAGETRADIRLGAYEAEAKLLQIAGGNRYFCCGRKFTLSGHPQAALNGSWVVTEHRLEASPDGFHCELRAIPATTVFHTPRAAHRPTIASTQTAIVVGPSGSEISSDRYGRVKVQFHWDRVGKSDENSSCWIRVAQGWAGTGWGGLFIPRIGNEVVVSFLDGDPDNPLITGAVYNAQKTVPYTLPDNQTRSTVKSQSSPNGSGKFNEIRFEDKAGSEELYVHAQKDMTLEVLNDNTATITKDDSLTVNGKQTISVKQDRSLTVTDGNETHKVSTGTRSVTVKGDETHTNNGKFTHSVDGDYSLSVAGKMSISVTGGLTVKASDITIESSSGAVTIKAAQGLSLKAGTDLDAEAGVGFTAKGTNVTVQGSAQLNVQGAMANFKADGMAEVSAGGIMTVKGALVQIN